MGYGLEAYVLDIGVVARAIGSRDDRLFAVVHAHLCDGLPADDEEREQAEAAARRVIHGEPADDLRPDICWSGVRALCRRLGEWLVPRHLCPFGISFLDDVPALKDVVFGGTPDPLRARLGVGEPDDTALTWIPRDQLDEALTKFAPATEPTDDADVAEAIAEFRSWIERARSKRLDLIVCLV